MNAFVDELRAVVRSVRRSPRYFLLASTCLALGIGVNAAMFAVVDPLFLRPPIGVQDPQRVTRLYFNRHVPVGRTILTDLASFPTVTDLRDGAGGFRGVTGYDATVVSEGRGADATKLRAGLASVNYFNVLGNHAVIGRLFQAGDGSMAAPPVAVVSDRLWHSRFGGRVSVIGRTLLVAGRVYTIVGVTEQGFMGVDIDPIDVWLPLEIAAGDLIMPGYQTRRGAMALSLLARLAPGVSRQAAEADATRAFRLGMRSIRSFDSTDRVILAPLLRDRGPKESDRAKVAAWLAGVSFAVLLIACINCAGLMLLRLLRREAELAVRTVLGATQATLMRLVMLENVALALFTAMLATGVAVAALAIFGKLLLPGDSPAMFVPVARLFVFAVVVALVVGAVTAVPVTLIFLARRVTISARLGVRPGMTRRSHARSASLVVQIGLVTALLIGAGLFGESLYNARTLDLGFEPRDVFAANVDFPGFAARSLGGESHSQLYRDLENAVRQVPGVAAVGVTSSLPFQYLGAGVVSIPGRDSSTLPTLPVFIASASEGYLATVGLRLKAGRWFTEADNASVRHAAVINETMARVYWPGESPWGKCVTVGDLECMPVVGIVADTRIRDIREDRRSQLYVSERAERDSNDRSPRTLVFRANRPEFVLRAVRAAIQSTRTSLPYVSVQSFESLIAPQRGPWTMGATMLALFGALALLLAAVGLYGSMSWIVADRAFEFGVRMALGASRGRILRQILAQVLGVLLGGVPMGCAIALYAGRAVEPHLFRTPAVNLDVFAATAAMVLLVGCAACSRPARRAMRINPMEALRS